MAQNVWMQPPPPQNIPPSHHVQRGGRSWFHTLWVGILLFILATFIMFFTGNPNLYPTVILIGNFLIPVVFVVFLYDHQHLSLLSTETIGRSFGIGGILGVLGASVLESLLITAPTSPNQGLSLGSSLLVGLIEEGCKIAAVMFLARKMRHTTQMDGLLLGAAVGMGFAALESTGYAFTAFLTSNGHVTASIISTVLRGLFASFGHGVWTGILGAVLFRESGPRHFRIDIPVIFTYLLVSILHGFWDGLPATVALYIIIPPGFPISVVTIVLAIIGVVILTSLYRRALHQRIQQAQFSQAAMGGPQVSNVLMDNPTNTEEPLPPPPYPYR
jgi:protease PrsW